ncbi:hypothetical protein SAMN05421780_110160 [Flexibacter flexilis DSM 6793]|uniref:Uncharacterized protein n=1 Tax=Flexibacter flexilis DSM 6793 TaxID=927664 RepID=A0A1I1MFJ1_9BACT|nr:hypothetical protein SAMN05421780_110160 [Flexibacter flexilis DSM 6793]
MSSLHFFKQASKKRSALVISVLRFFYAPNANLLWASHWFATQFLTILLLKRTHTLIQSFFLID